MPDWCREDFSTPDKDELTQLLETAKTFLACVETIVDKTEH